MCVFLAMDMGWTNRLSIVGIKCTVWHVVLPFEVLTCFEEQRVKVDEFLDFHATVYHISIHKVFCNTSLV